MRVSVMNTQVMKKDLVKTHLVKKMNELLTDTDTVISYWPNKIKREVRSKKHKTKSKADVTGKMIANYNHNGLCKDC